ncbi:MAG: putative FmdB family regulatory protein [Gammaproteobacteria bacterium]|jgi:putative FmdB family regulatory protein
MPIYEYDCGACDHQFETIRKISDGPLTTCPSCNEDALTKRISKVAFRLKGTGWYETDFKDKPKPKDAGGETSEGKSSAKSDGQPDSKTSSASKESSGGESKSTSSAESTSKSTTKSAET